jgi:zinc/manganese transport system permease protein
VTDFLVLFGPFLLCLLIAASHTYFGLHVLARGIVFVDLAIAQSAALGASTIFLFDDGHNDIITRLFAFFAAVATALLFTQLRRTIDRTMREAAVGCVYVVTAALSVLILSRSVHGMEGLKALLNGNILWTRSGEIAFVAIVYALVAIPFVLWHDRFRAMSDGANSVQRGHILWECVFFVSFAVTITVAVNVAGILIVFAFLIIPALSASLLGGTWRARLMRGCAIGAVGASAGLTLAHAVDLPAGATVVSVLGVAPLVVLAIRGLLRCRTTD